MAGLFFCLAPDTVQGFYFALLQYSPHTSVYSAFCAVNAVYTTHATKQRTGLYRCFSCDLSHSTAANTRQAKAAIIPPATRWSISQRRNTSSTYQIPPKRRTLYSSTQTVYYNEVYKGAAVCPCYGSMPDSAAYRIPCQPGGVSYCRPRIAGKCCTRRTC